ncbi:MAG: hypothetical protein IPP71_07015 [Bacteroidetes bacterium]|nr:hypothetical protein [Bacteroidota bacterium]
MTIILSGLLTLMNLSEFYIIGILDKTAGYPFGGEGPTPYYYKTARLYSTVNLIWGVIFLTTLVLAIRTTIKGQRKNIFWFLGLTILLILGQFLQGQIGT